MNPPLHLLRGSSLLFADIRGHALQIVSLVPKKSKEETRNDVTRKLEFVAVSLSGLHSEREESLAGKSNRIEEERSVTSVSVEKGHVLNQQQQNPPTRLAPASSSLHTWSISGHIPGLLMTRLRRKIMLRSTSRTRSVIKEAVHKNISGVISVFYKILAENPVQLDVEVIHYFYFEKQRSCQRMRSRTSCLHSGNCISYLVGGGGHGPLDMWNKQVATATGRKTPSALSDSNCYPREENDTAVAESLELKQEESVLDVEIGPLREKVSELESRCQDLINENTALKQDVDRWKIREASLLEKSNQVNPEEMKRLETKVDDPKNEMQSTQETSKEQQLENKNLKELKALRLQIMTLRTANHILKKEKELPSNDNKKVADEMEKLRAQLQTTQLELANLKNSQVCRDMEQVSKEMDKAGKLLEEQKNTVMAVQSIASKYKNEKQYQDVQKEQEERGIARPGQPEGSANNVKIGDNDITEVREEENSERDAEIKKLHDEIAILKRDADLAKANCRMRNRIKNLRKELSSTKAQNTEAEGQKNELQMKCSKLEESVEERDVRFAAMKSQYEDHLIHLEEENKDLKATSLCPTPTEYLTVLQEKDELKKENVMIKQRMEALENQTSIVVNPEKVLPIENSKTNIGVIAGPSPNRKKRSDCDNVLKRLEKKQKMKQKRYNIFMARKGTHPKYNEAPKSDQKMMTAYSSIRLNVGAGTKRRKNSETKTPKSTPPSTLRNDELPPKLRHMVIPASLPAQFLLLAQANTERNVETGGFLVGKIRGDQLFITHLIIPKQTGTSDSFVTTNEFETFGLNLSQFKNDLLTMGWIHTHPSQTAFLSSVDMHNHFLQQSSLPESIAIVCSVKDYE
ncbi:unnamed protein product [Orchesella dallaii]|uniref:MPN domain-containing protein n=1 Tax=Orchesella dallaii TaxID=48710 RepID=A0ABP1R4M7_9HEXA